MFATTMQNFGALRSSAPWHQLDDRTVRLGFSDEPKDNEPGSSSPSFQKTGFAGIAFEIANRSQRSFVRRETGAARRNRLTAG